MKEARNKQPKKALQKTAAVSQGQDQGKTNQAKQGNESKKARKGKKRRGYPEQRDKQSQTRDASSAATRTNIVPATGGDG